jgi:hypothetical protein
MPYFGRPFLNHLLTANFSHEDGSLYIRNNQSKVPHFRLCSSGEHELLHFKVNKNPNTYKLIKFEWKLCCKFVLFLSSRCQKTRMPFCKQVQHILYLQQNTIRIKTGEDIGFSFVSGPCIILPLIILKDSLNHFLYPHKRSLGGGVYRSQLVGRSVRPSVGPLHGFRTITRVWNEVL